MDVFIRGIPEAADDSELKEVFELHLHRLNIQTYELKRLFNKTCATLTLIDAQAGQQVLLIHGKRPNSRNNRGVPIEITVKNRPLYLEQSRDESDVFVVRRLKNAANVGAAKPEKASPTQFLSVVNVETGFFDYRESGRLTFHRCYRDDRKGRLIVGRGRLLVKLSADVSNQENAQLLVDYNIIKGFYASTNTKQPVLILVLQQPPTFYSEKIASNESDILGQLMNVLELNHHHARSPREPELHRICNLGPDHSEVVSRCFVYVVSLEDHDHMKRAVQALRHEKTAPNPSTIKSSFKVGEIDYKTSYRAMQEKLDAEPLPFSAKFQLQMLVENGVLPPRKVQQLIPHIKRMLKSFDDEVRVAEGIRSLHRTQPYAGPGTSASWYEVDYLVKTIESKAHAYPKRGSMYQIAHKHAHLAMIYRVFISPSGLWLEGPVLETKNRVLRKYPEDMRHFLRVQFCDEDGDQLKYERKVNRSDIFQRQYKAILDNGIKLMGQIYKFLGFSHSSLRTQSCWFMAPFWNHQTSELMISQKVIRGLGDFERITCPAKCAARIGQAFSDATDTIPLDNAILELVPDIERNGRCFSDGNGTISAELLHSAHREFLKSRKAYASVIQIRCQGYKGVLALDDTLHGTKACFRNSMNKFPSPDHMQLEITGAAYRPLPLFLNRQFIVIMEALGVSAEAFLALQRAALEQLELMTKSPVNAARYAELQHFGSAIGLSQLLRSLHYNGFHFKDDPFLRQVIEMATRVQLRELKHKARIPVPNGHTLFGIIDTAGFLKADEVHVILKDNRKSDIVYKTGTCILTRAPAMHPGDFQKVTAVSVPENSPNASLFNCVIFSQYGSRDIPSMLSGGDLDGDLYNVIFDKTLFPRDITAPAEYPRVKAADIGRPVEIADMSNFFLEFMEQDKLGYICNSHLTIADQKEESVFHEDCITLAEMASMAVDFSKTGVPAPMSKFPNYNRKKRPDFMAPAPHLVLDPEQSSIGMEDELDFHDLPDTIADALNAGQATYRYYESRKVLGRLYRNIDETQFLAKMEKDYDLSADTVGQQAEQGQTFLQKVFESVRAIALHVHWDSTAHRQFAATLRESYERNLIELMYHHSPYRQPLSELEVICSTILGRNGSTPNKRAREHTTDMKESFARLARYTTKSIKTGHMDSDDDDEESEDGDGDGDYLDWDVKSTMSATVHEEKLDVLERSIACLAVAVEESGHHYGRAIGYLRSFPYLVAGVCLQQVEQYRQMMKRMSYQEGRSLGAARSTIGGRAKTRVSRNL